jgi:predicted choloylglycine hydrolase
MRVRAPYIASIIAILLASCVASRQPAETPDVKATPIAATLPAPVVNPVHIVQLRGTPTEIGTQHGQQLGDEIRLLHDKYLMVMLEDNSVRIRAMLAAASFEAHMLPEHRDEIAALGNASGINHLQTVLAQCFLDLTKMMACSTIALPASASPDGVGRMGRNLDFPSLSVADKHSVLLIYRPQGKIPFAAVSWPGLAGVLSGMNADGLCLSNMEVNRLPRLPMAMPYTLLYRVVLEDCKTVDEAVALLEKTPRQTANNLMLMDAAGNRAVVEITPESIVVRRGAQGAALISTNHQRGQDTATLGRCWRYDLLHQSAETQYGQLNEPALQTLMGKVVQGPGGEMTLQSMIFEPSNRILYLAIGADAPHHGYERIDLKKYFQE